MGLWVLGVTLCPPPSSPWCPIHAVTFNLLVLLLLASHTSAVFADPGERRHPPLMYTGVPPIYVYGGPNKAGIHPIPHPQVWFPSPAPPSTSQTYTQRSG